MTYLGQKVNASALPPADTMEPVPEGEYMLSLVSTEAKETKDKTGKLLNCEYVILEGEYKGKKIFGMFNLWNKSDKAKEIAWRQLGELCRAVGYYKELEDTKSICQLPFKAKVIVKSSEGYKPRNEISEFIAKQGNTPTQAPVDPKSVAETAGQNDVPPWLANA